MKGSGLPGGWAGLGWGGVSAPGPPSGRPTWHLMSMLKNSSPGSCGSASPRRRPRLLCVTRSPGRLPTLARWSSSRRLCELAMRSRSSSVCGEAVSEGWAVGARRGRGPRRLGQAPDPSCPPPPAAVPAAGPTPTPGGS